MSSTIPECECSGPGFCKRLGYTIGERGWEVCANRCPSEDPCPELERVRYFDALNLFLRNMAATGKNTVGVVIGAKPRAGHVPTPLAQLQPSAPSGAPARARLSLPKRAGRLAVAVNTWIAAGRPLRDAAEQTRIHLICTGSEGVGQCEEYDAKGDRCKQCGCGLSPKARGAAAVVRALGIPNAVAMATYHCPLDRW